MMKASRAGVIVSFMLLIAAIAAPESRADSISYFLTLQDSGGTIPGSGPYAMVTLTEVDLSGQQGMRFDVSSLIADFEIIKFQFNAPSSTAGFFVLEGTSGNLSGASLAPASGSANGFGVFEWVFDTGLSGGPDFSQSSWWFIIRASDVTTDLTIGDFQEASSGGQGTSFFAARMQGAEESGWVDRSVVVPEPASALLVGSGLVALGEFMRRRKGKKQDSNPFGIVGR